MLKIREKIPPVNLYQRPVTKNNTGFKPNFKGLSSDTFNNSKGPLHFDSVEEAETYAKEKLGLDEAKFFDENLMLANLTVDEFNELKNENLILANLAVDGLNDVKKAGYDLPKNVIADYDIFDYPDYKIDEPDGSKREQVPAAVNLNELDTIYLNPKYIWTNIKARMSKLIKEKKITIDNPKRFVYHEIGHLLHIKANISNFDRFRQEIPPGKDKELIEKYLGTYTSKNYAEFVAECFTAKVLGKKLPDRINELYKKWNGPEVSSVLC